MVYVISVFVWCLVFGRVVLFGWFLLVVWLGVWFDGGVVIVGCCGCVAASLVLSGAILDALHG